MKKRYYEVFGYSTSSDFDGRNFTIISDWVSRKDDAITLAKLACDEYFIVKVQSMDREFIELYSNKKRFCQRNLSQIPEENNI